MQLQKDMPDHHDAELIIKLYDLRREASLREARSALNSRYWPGSADEAIEVTRHDHPLYTAFRQVAGYWEMVFGMAHHGIVHPDYLVENSGEGLLLFTRIEPYLDAIRAATNPRYFVHAEWAARFTEMGRAIAETHRKRIASVKATRAS
jgi:hypothetical protein